MSEALMCPDELLALARRIVWYKQPEETLRNRGVFLAHLMTRASEEDLSVARRHFPDQEFLAVLDQPPPGIFTEQAWERWNRKYGRVPVPPMPRRQFPDGSRGVLWSELYRTQAPAAPRSAEPSRRTR